MSSHRFVLTDTHENIALGNWQFESEQEGKCPFTIQQEVLHGGVQEGCEVITLACPTGLTIRLIPTRGMSILDVVSAQGGKLGWRSPIDEVVHPKTVTLESYGGTGWGLGFNEMMVRCGYAWAGHPVQADGMLYTLHGRAGNLQASRVEIEIDEVGTVFIRGLMKEKAFKNVNFEIWTELSHTPGTQHFTLRDVITNRDEYPHDYQTVYHSNIGTPMLSEGARFMAPVREISPFSEDALPGLAQWQHFAGPTRDFGEMMFNIIPYADGEGKTLVAIHDAQKQHGMAIRFDTKTLPALSLWKNLDTLTHGYVTGIEPGTGFCYPVTIEREQGRVKQLAAGQSVTFSLSYHVLHGKEEITAIESEINAVQADRPTTVIKTPLAHE